MTLPTRNLLIELLPIPSRTRLLSLLQPIALPVNTVLYEPSTVPDHVHFLTSGLASVVTGMEDGDVAEVGIIGSEGLPESLHLLGATTIQTRCFMQIGGAGLRIAFRDFQRLFLQDEDLRRVVLRYVQFQSVILSQLAACNRLHEVEERLARWLLMVEDRVGEPHIRLTQEFLAQMLGARRSTVTVVAGTLQRSGLIEYKRGQVWIQDRGSLELAACECYSITERLLADLRHHKAHDGTFDGSRDGRG